ncbi:MAG TPA: muconolactone Delta-isomerase family protein [Saprospiraceae bacterium]|nr:muconolactone Delta-isomerase family protein [Saprospiraceae bacterium]
MKRSYMVEFELPDQLTEDFLARIPRQRLVVAELLAEGVIRSYSLALDRSMLWVIVDAESEFEVMEVIAQLPLSDYMHPFVSELFFHNSPEPVQAFSLN